MTYYVVTVSVPGYLPEAEPYVVADEHAPTGVLEAMHHDVEHFAPEGEEGDAWDKALDAISADTERADTFDTAPGSGFRYALPDGYNIEATAYTRDELIELGYDPSQFHGLREYVVVSELGERRWQAEDADHAREQHLDAHPDEAIVEIREP